MGIIDSLFKSKSKKEPDFEIEKYHILADDCKHRVKIIDSNGDYFYAEEFLKKSKKLLFSRVFIMGEDLIRPHFAPSLEEAINWFIGKSFPRNGCRDSSWGLKSNRQCVICDEIIQVPIHIKTIECLTIYKDTPDYREIVGWRVSEVESELLGRGVPTKIFTIHRDHTVIKWNSPKEKFICERCDR